MVAQTDSIARYNRIKLLEKAGLVEDVIAEKGFLNGFNGTILIAQKGEILFANAYGVANKQTQEPIDLFSNFQLASVSKTITATAIMILKDNGLLNFDDEVVKHIPDFPYSNITIRHLLTHRSGLADYIALSGNYGGLRNGLLSNEAMHNLFVTYKPRQTFPTGKGFKYQNTNYGYLALIVQRITKVPFDEFVDREIFLPAGMFSSKILNPYRNSVIPMAVKGHHSNSPNTPINEYKYALNGVMGDKGAYSNVSDLLAFDQALHTYKLVKKETLDEAFTNGSPDPVDYNYGLGFRLKRIYGTPIIYHNGWWQGFKAAFRHYPTLDMTLIVLTNSDKKFSIPNVIEYLLISNKWDLNALDAIPESE